METLCQWFNLFHLKLKRVDNDACPSGLSRRSHAKKSSVPLPLLCSTWTHWCITPLPGGVRTPSLLECPVLRAKLLPRNCCRPRGAAKVIPLVGVGGESMHIKWPFSMCYNSHSIKICLLMPDFDIIQTSCQRVSKNLHPRERINNEEILFVPFIFSCNLKKTAFPE